MSQQPRNRWLLSIVLVVGAIAFIGFSLLPLFQSGFQPSQPSTDAAPAVNQTPLGEQKSKLAAEARDYEVVLQQEPDNQAALRGLVDARIKLGDLEGAIAPLEKLIALEPTDFNPVLVKALVLQQQGKTEQAKPLFEKAAALAPVEYKDKINSLAAQQPAEQKPATNPKQE